MYTSGCPKNQNRCWNRIGSPPPLGSKKDVFTFRSVNSIVIAAARTGRDKRSNTTVTLTAQTNSCIRSRVSPLARAFIIVVKKFKEPRMEEAPAKCNEKIVRSIGGPEWPIFDDRGG